MISLHYWSHEASFSQIDFINKKELVSWLVENLVVFSNKYGEYNRHTESEAHKVNFEIDLQNAESDQEIEKVLENWENLCNNDFLKLKQVRKLLNTNSFLYYVNDKFAYEYLSLHKF